MKGPHTSRPKKRMYLCMACGREVWFIPGTRARTCPECAGRLRRVSDQEVLIRLAKTVA